MVPTQNINTSLRSLSLFQASILFDRSRGNRPLQQPTGLSVVGDFWTSRRPVTTCTAKRDTQVPAPTADSATNGSSGTASVARARAGPSTKRRFDRRWSGIEDEGFGGNGDGGDKHIALNDKRLRKSWKSSQHAHAEAGARPSPTDGRRGPVLEAVSTDYHDSLLAGRPGPGRVVVVGDDGGGGGDGGSRPYVPKTPTMRRSAGGATATSEAAPVGSATTAAAEGTAPTAARRGRSSRGSKATEPGACVPPATAEGAPPSLSSGSPSSEPPPVQPPWQPPGPGPGSAPPPPAPMGGGPLHLHPNRPPPGSVMSGWELAGGQPQMNSVYRLIRKKELQHNYHNHHRQQQQHHHHHPGEGSGGGPSAAPPPPSSPSSGRPTRLDAPRPPGRGPRAARDTSPRLGDLQRRQQHHHHHQHKHHKHQHQHNRHDNPQPQNLMRLQQEEQDMQQQLPQHQHHLRAGLEAQHPTGAAASGAWAPQPPPQPPPPPAPPPPPLVPFSSGHAAVDRVVRIRQIEMRRRQRQCGTDGSDSGGGGGGGVGGGDGGKDYGSRQARARGSRPPPSLGSAAPPAAAAAQLPPAAGVWAADRVPTALLGGRTVAEGRSGGGRSSSSGSGVDGAGRCLIEVTLADPQAPGGTARGAGGDGDSVSSLLRETLISDLSLLNPVYRMIRKHELLQRHPQPASSGSSAAPAAAARPAPSSTAPSPSSASSSSSTDPWVADDLADVMLGGLVLPPPLQPPGSLVGSAPGSETGEAATFTFTVCAPDDDDGASGGAAAAAAGRRGAARFGGAGDGANGASDDDVLGGDGPRDEQEGGQATETGRLNPVLRLIRKKQLQRRLRLRGRLAPEPFAAAAAAAEAVPPPPLHQGAPLADGEAAGAGWEIGPADVVGGRAVLNPVYRLIRKKQLQSKRASREAAAAKDVTPAALPGRGGPQCAASQPHLLSTPSAAAAADADADPDEAASWRRPRGAAPFFNLGRGLDLGVGFSDPGSTLAEALDPMAAGSWLGLGSVFGPVAARGAGDKPPELAIRAADRPPHAEADAASAPPSGRPPPPPPLAGVSEQLIGSLVGERSHMNHVYRLIRKKELQLRQRGVLPREAPPAPPADPGPAAASGGAAAGAAAAAAAAPLAPPPVVTSAAKPPGEPSALLHPFDPVDEQDEHRAPYGAGAAAGVGALTGYGSRILLGATYDDEYDEDYGDDEGAYWSADEGSWEEYEEQRGSAAGRSAVAGAATPPLPLPPASAAAMDATVVTTAADEADAAQPPARRRRTAAAQPEDAPAAVMGGVLELDGQRPASEPGLGNPGNPASLQKVKARAGRRRSSSRGAQTESPPAAAAAGDSPGLERRTSGGGATQADDGGNRGIAATARRRRIGELKASLRAKLLLLASSSTADAAPTGAATAAAAPDKTGPAEAPTASRSDQQQSSLLRPRSGPRSPASSPATAAVLGAAPSDSDRGTTTWQTAAADSAHLADHPEQEGQGQGPGKLAATARPLPWQLARRAAAAAADRSGGRMSPAGSHPLRRRTGSGLHRAPAPGLMRFLLDNNSPGVEPGYGNPGDVTARNTTSRWQRNSSSGARGDDGGAGGGGRGVVRSRTPLFSGIAQLWDAVGLRVGPLPPAQPHGGPDVDVAVAMAEEEGVRRSLAALEALLTREGVSADLARRLSSSWPVQSRGWQPEEVLERLRGLQSVLEGPAPAPALGSAPGLRQGQDQGPKRRSVSGASWRRGLAGRPGRAAAGAAASGGGGGLAAAAAAAAKQPNLLTREPAALEANLAALAAALGMDRRGAQVLARTWPSVLELRQASLRKRLRGLADALGLTCCSSRANSGGGGGGECGGDEGGGGEGGGGDGCGSVAATASSFVVPASAAAGVQQQQQQQQQEQRKEQSEEPWRGQGMEQNDGHSEAADADADVDAAVAAADDDDDDDGDDDVIASAAEVVRCYPPALALTQGAVAARMQALAEVIAVSLQQQQQQQQQHREPPPRPHRAPAHMPGTDSDSDNAAEPSQAGGHAASAVAVAVAVAACPDSNNGGGDKDGGGGGGHPALAPAAAAAAAARALALVSGQPGILGYSPEALASKWRALEAAIAQAEAELAAGWLAETAAAAADASVGGPGAVVAALESARSQEQVGAGAEPAVQASAVPERDLGMDLDLGPGRGSYRSGAPIAGDGGVMTRGSLQRVLLPWMRQLLEGPPAAVARCLAASDSRFQRLAFLAAAAAGGRSATLLPSSTGRPLPRGVPPLTQTPPLAQTPVDASTSSSVAATSIRGHAGANGADAASADGTNADAASEDAALWSTTASGDGADRGAGVGDSGSLQVTAAFTAPAAAVSPATARRPRGRPRKDEVSLVSTLRLPSAHLAVSAAAAAAAGLTAQMDVAAGAAAAAGFAGPAKVLEPRRLQSLSLSTILAMSAARFNERFPGFEAWQQARQERQEARRGR
ncbi:hypothetical protein PLESTB_001455000 [Pleodorina starrii]|uniref:Uncharacterized protein n=1 Tax=Pleodorina starrii TaxID=330485 RepID=A0A9W6F832_9CHLO|nr:hypothetical protein PLESTB_001455000 [Pleodorina starrii]